ncbi:hypothetical protein [Rubricoccus marinus]|uniref:Uncharacterized protein n=1 Tax=Rubricoccus marinus TaxID=716817 RepID=A0A259TX45_9BACT|nr:hypothetical protein [Rubricoccus marinus]OZC02335.1 hypothetical protein BSZ36_04690 [Rubricoccus marinus]
METPRRPSFDARAFWITLAACAGPFLTGLAVFFTGIGHDLLIGGALMAWCAAYAVALIWMVVGFLRGDSARGLAILLGMIAGVIVGPGACFGVFMSGGGLGSMN